MEKVRLGIIGVGNMGSSHIKNALEGEVFDVKLSKKLGSHPVCLATEGEVSLEMEKVLKQMPNGTDAKADIVMEINKDHPIAAKLKELFETDKEKLEKYSRILYAQARLIEGLSVDNPTELSNLICELMV